MWKEPLLHSFSARQAALLVAGVALSLAGCRQEPVPQAREIAYVSGAGVALRNELGPSSQVEMILESGERVEVLSRRPRWAQVRLASGLTGWIQERFLVSQQVMDRFLQLASEAGGLPSQGRANVRREANLRLEPSRTSQTFYRLAEEEEADVLAHRVAEQPARPSSPPAGASAPPGTAEPPPKTYEDWLLVRASRGRTGWLLETSVDMNPPLEVAQYREGLRIRAWFVLHREQDQGVERLWYLWATIRRSSGLPVDFDEIRVFVWNPAAHRYETSYRERNLMGLYPIQIGSRETPDGPAPTFRLQLQGENGQRLQKNYFMVGWQVRIER